jgi:hypothetical protein
VKWRSPAGKPALDLAREKGPAPIMNEEFDGHCRDAAQASGDGARRLEGRQQDSRAACCTRATAATCSASRKWRRRWSINSRRSARRFTHHTSIAPTGTISLSLANNASNGIEPSFAHHYFRNVIREGKKSKEKVDVFSFELLAYRELDQSRARCPNSSNADRAVARLLHHRRRRHADRSTSTSRRPRRSGSTRRSRRPPTCPPTSTTTRSRTSTSTPTRRA